MYYHSNNKYTAKKSSKFHEMSNRKAHLTIFDSLESCFLYHKKKAVNKLLILLGFSSALSLIRF